MKNLIKYYWQFNWVTMIAMGWSKEKYGNEDAQIIVIDIFILCFKISIYY